MSNRKWDVSEAATKRIEKRIGEMVIALRSDAFTMLMDAIEPENFAQPDRAVQELVTRWIRDKQHAWLCAQVFSHVWHRSQTLHANATRLINALDCLREDLNDE